MAEKHKMSSDSLSVEEEMKLIYGDFTPLDVLIAVHEFIDSVNVFAYKNWIKGRIVEGPFIERYWIEITVLYPFEDMPDPSAGMRLIKRGCDVKFFKDKIQIAKSVTDDDYSETMPPEQKRTAKKDKKVWMVKMRIPRHLIDHFIEKSKEPVR